MSLLWAIPPVAVAIGVVILMQQLRTAAEATEDLSLQLRRLDEVRLEVAAIRAESARARAGVEGLRGHRLRSR